jgi:heptosyltransferase I
MSLFSVVPLFSNQPNSVCFLRLSAIGDVCHTVAVVQALQKHWPDTKVTWIIGKVEAQLLQGIENVELIIFDKNAGFKGMQEIWKQLQSRHFDALIHMQIALRASLLTLGIKAKYKVGFNFKRAKEAQWLFTNRRIPDAQSQHVLDSFFSFIEYLGVERTTPEWRLPLNEEDYRFAETNISRTTIAICPAASKDERNWLPERYAQFADWVIEQGFQVVFCGSPTEREKKLSTDIQNRMQHQAINLVGKTTLKQLAAILKRANMVLAPDSGPAHIATTQGTPVIGLYGHSNPQRTGPYNSRQYVVSVYEHYALEQYGKLAEQLPWSRRVKGSHVMNSITLEAVQQSFTAIRQQFNHQKVAL